MEKQLMSHEDVVLLIKEGYDKKGFTSKKNPLWHRKVYSMWRHMWFRCYDSTRKDYKYYIDSIIHDDFRIFSKYLEWIQDQPRFEEFCNTCDYVTWVIDKDMKCPGNRNYFPEYMTLCTSSENSKEVNHRCQNAKHLHSDKHYSRRRVPIIGININDNTILIFKCAGDAVSYGFNKGAIGNVCKGIYPKHNNYKWYYFDMNDRKLVHDN